MSEHRYPAAELDIDADKIDADAFSIVKRLQQHGYQAYLVGGCVRDLILKATPKDFDISTDARPEQIKALFRNCLLIGRRFRLAHIRFGRKIIEVSTFRAGDPEEADLITRDNEYGTLEEDALRRDFTINGLYYDPISEEVIDSVNGIDDTKSGLIRTIGKPGVRFIQDPVRMIRLIKFRARFGFTIEQETHTALLANRQEILKSAKARVLEEFLRMLETSHSTLFIRELAHFGILELILPGIARLLESHLADTIYAYLEQIDMLQKERARPFQRAVLLSSLLLPAFEHHLEVITVGKEKISLELIQKEARRVVDEVYAPFLHIPRRLTSEMHSILTCQYRFTPFKKCSRGLVRVPRTPDFPIALDLFYLRSCIEPALTDTYSDWRQIYMHYKEKNHATARPRRTRR